MKKMTSVLTLFSMLMLFRNQIQRSLSENHIYETYPRNQQLMGRWSSKLVGTHDVAEPHTALVRLSLSRLSWECESESFCTFHHCSVGSEESQTGQCHSWATSQIHSVGRIRWFRTLKWVGMSVKRMAQQTRWLWEGLEDRKSKKIERKEVRQILVSCHPVPYTHI